MNTNIKIGWAEETLTPNESISLAGQFFERISEFVETPVTTTAMAIECGEEQMVMVSCDLCATSIDLLRRVRKALFGKVQGLDLNKIIINATHCHTSHVYNRGEEVGCAELDILTRFMPEDMIYKPLSAAENVMNPDEARDYIVAQVAKAVEKAWNGRKAGVYACGFGRAAVGMCRRVTYDDGSAKMWGDSNSANFVALEGGNDSGMELLFTFDEEKKITGVVVNIACPSQVVEHRSFVSADYWGKVKEYLRKEFGEELFVLGLIAPAGDQAPRDLIRWVNPETPIDDPNIERNHYIERRSDGSMFDIQGLCRIGKRISAEIVAAYEEIDEYFTDVPFYHKVERIGMPVRRVTQAEYAGAIKAIEDFVAANRGNRISFKDTAAMYLHAGIIERYEFQRTHDMWPIEMHFVRLGDIAIGTSTFELYLDYGNQIRARSKARQTFLIELCCGADGYLPTEKAEKGGHYSANISSGIAGHEAGDLLVRETLFNINNMFEE